jgi:hypothetical protein
MANQKKLSAVMLMLLLAASAMLIVELASAQSMPKPSVPEFTIKLVDDSYDEPAKTITDPYYGNTTTIPSSHVERYTVVLSIKNQAHDPNYAFLYDVRIKGHFENQWTSLFDYYKEDASSFTSDVWAVPGGYRPYSSSDSGYTVVIYGLVEHPHDYWLTHSFPVGAQVDFSVRASIYNVTRPPSGVKYQSTAYDLMGASDWSNTQTITIGENTVTPVPTVMPTNVPFSTPSNPTVTPQQPPNQTGDFFAMNWAQIVIVVMAVALVVMGAGLVLLWRKVASAK